ncbi:MAG: recombinase family protein [Butyrivibrio sp.]|nr:recombinase family protein [Butyrivibrio sp.]
MRAQSGSLRNFDRICYGYQHENKMLVPSFRAKYVKKIFDWYVYGLSILAIISKLEEEGIPSPSGKPKWSKAAIYKILTNEKYTGLGTVKIQGKTHIIENHHPAIVDTETFEYTQKLMKDRTNIIIMPDGTKKRKKTRYSSIKKN